MAVLLLNDNQRRRLVTHLRLLSQDLETLAQSTELAHPGELYEQIRALVARAREAADDLRGALDLPADRAPSFQRRVAALAEVWAVRMEDLVANRLTAYGPVHPGLASRLDPRVAGLRDLLGELADLAQRLPEA
jgi:hypothetical protein